MSISRRTVLRSIGLLGILSITGWIDSAATIIVSGPGQTGAQQTAAGTTSQPVSDEKRAGSSEICLSLGSVFESELDTASITPIRYSDLTSGEQYLVETATEREKRVHPNMRPEISLFESRLKKRNEDGMVYLLWNGFYYRIHYQNGENVLASRGGLRSSKTVSDHTTLLDQTTECSSQPARVRHSRSTP